MVARACVLIALLVNLLVSRADINRALALARWPHTAAERTRFHDPYFVFAATQGLGEFRTLVLQVEVVTEFRRVELLAEEHQQINDNFGRGGTDEVVQVMRPWRGKVAIDAHLQLPDQHDPIPATEIEIAGVGSAPARQVLRSVAFSRSSFPQQWLQGNMVESVFDAAAVGQTSREVSVIVGGRELARATVDFSKLE